MIIIDSRSRLDQCTVGEAEPGADSCLSAVFGCSRAPAVLNQMDAGEAAVKRLGLTVAEEEKSGGLDEEEEEEEDEEDEEGERSESEPDDAEVSTMPGMAEAANIAINESLPNTDDGEAAPFAGRFNIHKCPVNINCASALSNTLTPSRKTNKKHTSGFVQQTSTAYRRSHEAVLLAYHVY